MFERVLIANRGEIAVRIIRTLRRLGIASVAVYSDADVDSPHVRLADDAVRIGPPPALDSYLRIDRIIDAALSSRAQALHPGYGFLAENAQLADSCSDAGIVFVGPPRDVIEAMGDKIRAKQTVARAGVRTVPGSDGSGLTDEQLTAAADQVGFPVLIKPSAGGGGKGMRLVHAPAELEAAIASARREARNAFGDETLLVERFIERPRHIEIQVLADAHGNVVHLGERECSLQRRHQKVIEEAPSPLLTPEQRAAMGVQAVAAARACGYVNAGTVEFIVSGVNPDDAFFMEMNTRLQVEHPVTEAVWGVDLVELQLRVAAGGPLPFTQEELTPTGHAIEARVYAEDPHHEFLPTGGRVLVLDEAEGEGVRVDSGLAVGVDVGGWYDPMLAKVIAWGADRAEALRRLDTALASTTILGVTTNVSFLRALLGNGDVIAGALDTGLVERELDGLVERTPPFELRAAAALADLVSSAAPDGPWATRTGWRLGGSAAIASPGGETVQWRDDRWFVTGVTDAGDVPVSIRCDGDTIMVDSTRVRVARSGRDLWVGASGSAWMFRDPELVRPSDGRRGSESGTIESPMPGTVVAVLVEAGAIVEQLQPLVVVEAMKMEHTIRAPIRGEVTELPVAVGQKVALGQTIAVVVPGAASEMAKPEMAEPEMED